MIINELKQKSSNRFLFSRYRTHLRYYIAPIFLLFGAVDYIYKPQFFSEWFLFRIIFIVFVYVAFGLIAKFKKMRNNIKVVIYATSILPSWIVTKMIIDSGGYDSIYVSGLVLCCVTAIQIFRLKSYESFFVQLVSFLPAIMYFLIKANPDTIHFALIQSSFLISMAVLSLIYKNSDDELEASNKIFYNILNSEIIKLRRMDILNRHFPKVIRDSLEQNPQLFKNKQVLPTAVIGFVDIVSSCAISNNVPLYIEWELKERFMEAATKRAMETEMVVLTYAGDAFLFLANFRPDSLWYYNLIIFYENLVKDYDLICKDLNLDLENITSGIKFGITQGPVVLGFLGKSQAYFTVIGPDVNLAARLSSQAKPNQIVVSSRIWHSMKPLLVGWDHEFNEYSDLKGFDCVIPTVHLFPKQLRMSKTDFVCAICESTMSLIKTEEGTLDFRCVNGHSTPKMATKIKMLKSS